MSAPVEDVALIGAGVIGASWAAQVLVHGHRARVSDPADGAEERLRRDIERALPALARLGHDPTGWRDRLLFTTDVEEAVAGAGFVQESGPEREDVKAQVIAAIDAVAPPEVVVASSTSGLLPSTLAAMAPRHPERVLVGHPFNPVHLIPLVEVVQGPGTSQDAVRQALAFYARLGKRPIHVRRELPGHVTNRLQAALWREAYSLVERGVASVADVDAAIAHGPGLRWALLGPLVNQHLSGGDAGLAHTLRHLGPPAQLWMDDLGAPQLTDSLAALLVAGVDEELADIDQVAMVAQRDDLLVDLLLAKARSDALP